MQLQTEVEIEDYPFTIDYSDNILALGSCFAQEMAHRLSDHKFEVGLNPWGILYNPISVANLLERLSAADYQPTLFHHEGLWRSLDHHSDCAHPDQQKAMELCRSGQAEVRRSSRLLVTLGTAHVFEREGRVVANCHRLPQSQFQRRRLQVAEVVERLGPALEDWLGGRSERRAILTVSPVRYLRDGLLESQRSKAVLLLAAEQLCSQLEHLYYFPAYEILLDELRDYRFYARDLAHPSEVAVDYIWERVQQRLLSDAARSTLAELEGLLRAARHRPRRQTEATHLFARRQLDKLEELQRRHPQLALQNERLHFESLLDFGHDD